METQQTSEATGDRTNADQSTGLRQQHGGEWVEKAIAILFDEEDRAEVARDYQAGDEYALSQFNIRIEELARKLEATHKAAIEQAHELHISLVKFLEECVHDGWDRISPDLKAEATKQLAKIHEFNKQTP